MSKGIAVEFVKRFGQVEALQKQGKEVGEVAVLEHEGRFVYYLITKLKYFYKPTYGQVVKALEAMHAHCLSHGVKQLAIPQLGSGLDKLEWKQVKQHIQEVFADGMVHITVYSLPKSK